MQVYKRLNYLNVSLSYNAVLRIVTNISKHHTVPFDNWLKEGSFVKFVGDNVDKTVGVRDIRSDHHGELKHMYSLLVVKARVQPPPPNENFVPLPLATCTHSEFLPTPSELESIKHNMQVLVSRILCDYIPAFKTQERSVTPHIPHEYSTEMAIKSDVVVMDVLHKNEAKGSDMIDIMRGMASYLTSSFKLTALSGGDHVTCERQQGSKRHVMCSNTREGRLEQLEPCCEDWHCLMNFLMVKSKKYSYYKYIHVAICIIHCHSNLL